MLVLTGNSTFGFYYVNKREQEEGACKFKHYLRLCLNLPPYCVFTKKNPMFGTLQSRKVRGETYIQKSKLKLFIDNIFYNPE